MLAQPITPETLEHLPGFVAAQVRCVARTHGKTIRKYHPERIPLQDFSPWLYLRESKWWLDYGGTGTPLVAVEREGGETDDTEGGLPRPCFTLTPVPLFLFFCPEA